MQERDQLLTLCNDALATKGLTDPKYQERLKIEMKEIDVQADHEYLLDLYNKKLRFPYNENNLLVAYLLDLCDAVDMEQPPAYVQGEFPDIDMDYLPFVRDYLKNEWAARVFGQENICSIGTYGTLGIKSALLDSTRVHGIPKDEIQAITRSLEDKDDDGEDLTWNKAFELYPALKEYCEKHPDIAEAAQVLTHRNKSGGVHAGGLIISSKPIADFVPLEVRSVNKDNKYGVIVSAWTEGQAKQDLQPVGLIKFDLLVVDGLMQIAQTCKLIRERHPEVGLISALPDSKRSWSDVSFLNDPKAIAMANKADLKCIFQFGSDGIRKLVKKGGVDSFDDIAAYSALYRPGPLGMGMAEKYCLRKKGLETVEIHPLMKPFLGKTWGVLVFQEQVMQILHAVGDIPLIHCEKVRKAISKKKIKQFAKYKEMFLVNGQKNLNASLEYVQELWDQIEAFADYGFNMSHSYAYSYISAMQLYLKAHYPLEFYTSVFQCEDDSKKIKTYRLDAHKHGIELKPVHINKSKKNFSIVGNDIYYGFYNLKGIGDVVAEQIAAAQPYASMTDFLDRFGTDAKVLKSLISLGCFEEDEDRLTQYKFYESYKKFKTARKEAVKRQEDAQAKYREDLLAILKEHCKDEEEIQKYNRLDDDVVFLWENRFGGIQLDEEYKYKGELRTRKITVSKMLIDVKKKVESSLRNYESKAKDAEEEPPSIETFNADRFKLDKKMEEIIQKLFSDDGKAAENEFYGFQWTHELEESPDYEGYTLDRYNQELDQGNETCIEVKVLDVTRKDFKSGKGHAFNIRVEDADGRDALVKFWSDDYERFEDELKIGNLIRIRVKPPLGNFSSYTFDAPQKHLRWKVLPRDKNEDYRLILMKKGEPKVLTKKKVKVDLSDCTFIDMENL